MPQVPCVIPDGDEIRARREELNLTPADFARTLRRHPQTIRRIESGRQAKVSRVLIRQIARALNTDAESITKDPADEPAGIAS